MLIGTVVQETSAILRDVLCLKWLSLWIGCLRACSSPPACGVWHTCRGLRPVTCVSWNISTGVYLRRCAPLVVRN